MDEIPESGAQSMRNNTDRRGLALIMSTPPSKGVHDSVEARKGGRLVVVMCLLFCPKVLERSSAKDAPRIATAKLSPKSCLICLIRQALWSRRKLRALWSDCLDLMDFFAPDDSRLGPLYSDQVTWKAMQPVS